MGDQQWKSCAEEGHGKPPLESPLLGVSMSRLQLDSTYICNNRCNNAIIAKNPFIYLFNQLYTSPLPLQASLSVAHIKVKYTTYTRV